MEATAKIMEPGAEPASLAQQFQQYAKAHGVKPESLAKEIGYSRTTLTRYLSGAYNSSAKGIETQIARFLAEHTGEVVMLPGTTAPAPRPQKPRFYESRDAKAALGVCQSCQEYGEMGIVTGRSCPQRLRQDLCAARICQAAARCLH